MTEQGIQFWTQAVGESLGIGLAIGIVVAFVNSWRV